MSLVPPDTDPRFTLIGAELASFAERLSDPPPFEGESPQAAVALVLRATSGLHVLLIKRARSERDPWSGQMALPGGRRDAVDATLLATAMRETLEEVLPAMLPLFDACYGRDIEIHGRSSVIFMPEGVAQVRAR